MIALEHNPSDARLKIIEKEICQTLTGRMGTGGGNVPLILMTYQDVTGTLSPGAHAGSYNGQDAYNDMLVTNDELCDASNRNIQGIGDSVGSETERPQGCYGSDSERGGSDKMNQTTKSVVRRLTPLECERLQGYPDGWTDIGEWTDTNGKLHKESTDSSRYKALGNSIALPFWRYLARRIMAQYEHEVTMGSLFDGLGGFPLVFEQCGAKAVWASEIEEFCIAVTKRHFPEDMGEND